MTVDWSLPFICAGQIAHTRNIVGSMTRFPYISSIITFHVVFVHSHKFCVVIFTLVTLASHAEIFTSIVRGSRPGRARESISSPAIKEGSR